MITILSLAILAMSFTQDIKLAVPNAAEQKKAEAEIRAVFKDEFAKKERDAKRSLAQRLLTESADAKNTPASRYAVLLLSRDLAIDSLDVTTAFKSIEAVEKLYDMAKPPLAGATFTSNLNALKIDALNKAQKAAITPEESAIIGEAYLRVAEDSARDRNFSDALNAAQAAEKYGRTAKCPGIPERASSCGKEVNELAKEDEEWGKAITTKADDPAARLVKGRYSLFVIGDEKSAFENLLGCSDEGLKKVAKLEAGGASSCEAMLAIAEGWASLASKETSILNKRRYKERALKWFDAAIKDSGGIQRTKIEKRMVEIARPVFYRGINLAGTPLMIDGHQWEGKGSASVIHAGQELNLPQVTLKPATDANRAQMIKSFIWNSAGTSVTVSEIPKGIYQVYLYTWEDNESAQYDLLLQKKQILTGYKTGDAGHWEKLGPWTLTISDGKLEFTAVGNSANFSGIEIWKMSP